MTERTKAQPKRGTVCTAHHEQTRETEKVAVCRNCGRDIENGWGYWTHSDDLTGSEFCAPPTAEQDKEAGDG